MTGQEAYEQHTAAVAPLFGADPDDWKAWGELTPAEQASWEQLADETNSKDREDA